MSVSATATRSNSEPAPFLFFIGDVQRGNGSLMPREALQIAINNPTMALSPSMLLDAGGQAMQLVDEQLPPTVPAVRQERAATCCSICEGSSTNP